MNTNFRIAPNQADNIANEYKSYATYINTQINNIEILLNDLKKSSNNYCQLSNTFSTSIENLNECKTQLYTMGCTLSNIASLYKKTEQTIVASALSSALSSSLVSLVQEEIRHLLDATSTSNINNTITNEGEEYCKSKQGCKLEVYNNGQTIGYGFDIKNFPDIKINYISHNPDTISQEEADRLFDIAYKKTADNVNKYLDSYSYILDEYSYSAVVDLVYNRGLNALTKEIIDAMATDNSSKVESLLNDFDYRYAKKYLYGDSNNSDSLARAYVTRNPGLISRRQEEYQMYKQKKYVK